MNLSNLKNVSGARRPAKRVGRGEASGHGKTSTRGTKGQYARSGHKYKANFEGGQMRLIRRMPKRGFNHASKVVLHPVNVAALDIFADGSEIDAVALRVAGLVAREAGPVKILGNGEIKKKLAVKADAFSASAKAKIEAAGGTCTIMA